MNTNNSLHKSCWLQRHDRFRKIVTNDMMAKDDAYKLVHCMNEVREKLPAADLACFDRWWLSTATQSLHVDLVSEILKERTYDMDAPVHCCTPRPLIVAISEGNIDLIKMFLEEGASVCIPYGSLLVVSDEQLASDMSQSENISAVQYACMLCEPEILDVLVQHHNDRHPPRTVVDPDAEVDYSEDDSKQSPLHVLVKMAKLFNGASRVVIPDLVQLVINAGGCVNALDAANHTPLQILLSNIDDMKAIGDMTGRSHQMIFDITMILLKAGAQINVPIISEPVGQEPLNIVLDTLYMSLYLDEISPHVAQYLTNEFQLVAQVTPLLLINGADPSRLRATRDITPIRIIKVAANIVEMQQRFADIYPVEDDPYDKLLDLLGTTFRYIWLSGVEKCIISYWDGLFENKDFINAIIDITRYSSKSGHSKKLMNMITMSLSGKQTNRLRRMLTAQRQQVLIDSSDEREEEEEEGGFAELLCKLDGAISWFANIETPKTLGFLACHAINQALPIQCRLGTLGVQLGLEVPSRVASLIRFE